MTWGQWLMMQAGSIYMIVALFTTASLPARHDVDAKVIRGIGWPVYWVGRAVGHYRKARRQP
jgi:hypothetical protein